MTVTALSIFLASTVASLSLDCLLHPLDTIKTRIQSREYVGSFRGPRTGILGDTRILRGLYQGLGPVLVTSFPSAGVFFFTYESIRTRLAFASEGQSKPTNSTLILSDICASSVAEVAACLIYAPTELLKQNAQVALSPSTKTPTLVNGQQLSTSPGGTLAAVLKGVGGPTKLWKGYWALLAHNLPWTIIQMPLYEALKRQMSRSGSQTKKHDTFEIVAKSSLSAAISGGITGFLTAPLDVIKTRVNLDSYERGSSGRKRAVKAMQNIIKAEGLRGLYRGCGINSFMAVVGSGLYFGLYEGGKQWLGDE
ncbi:mitochondrial carrier domain-containing protein [Penicillium sp. IBT 16267x]|nr:mitochondrial carrier domain-containing protein [Penicillium sp. IBT 16267x]